MNIYNVLTWILLLTALLVACTSLHVFNEDVLTWEISLLLYILKSHNFSQRRFTAATFLQHSVDRRRTVTSVAASQLIKLPHSHSADWAAVRYELSPVRPVLCHQSDLFWCRRVILTHHSGNVLMERVLGCPAFLLLCRGWYRAYLLVSSSSGFQPI